MTSLYGDDKSQPTTKPILGSASWFWAPVLLVGILPGFLLDPAHIVDQFMPVMAQSLEAPTDIDLGSLGPQEKRDVIVQIRNLGRRKLILRPIDTDCGCLVVNNAPTVLEAGESSTITASIQSPDAPGRFDRSLLIRSAEKDEVAWKVTLHGLVTASVWAEPALLELGLEKNGPTKTQLKIFHTDTFEIERVESTSQLIEIAQLRKLRNGVEAHLQFNGDANGQSIDSAAINVFVAGDQQRPALVVPVQFRDCSQIGFVPRILELPNYASQSMIGNCEHRLVAVLIPPDRSVDDIETTPLVPWMRIRSQRNFVSVKQLDLEFDYAAMPENFNEPVLSVRMRDQQADERLFATGFIASKTKQ